MSTAIARGQLEASRRADGAHYILSHACPDFGVLFMPVDQVQV